MSLDSLHRRLLALATEIESQSALFDLPALKPDIAALDSALASFSQAIAKSHRVPPQSFRKLLPAWLEALAKESKAGLLKQCKAAVDPAQFRKRKEESETAYARRLLVEGLLTVGEKTVAQWLEPKPVRKSSKPMQAADPAAEISATMKAWGQLSLREFEDQLSIADPELVAAIAADNGIKWTRKPTVKVLQKFHQECQRFFRNTDLSGLND